jgi:hypothetical protein
MLHIQTHISKFKLRGYMGCAKKCFRKLRVFRNGPGGGVYRFTISPSLLDGFTIRLQFWKVDWKVGRSNYAGVVVFSPPSGWILRLKLKEGRKRSIFPIPLAWNCTDWPRPYPEPLKIFYSSSTQTKPLARPVRMPTISFQPLALRD